jgi:rhodanese-related sulfurtransferase
MRAVRTGFEVLAFLALALVCALVSNAFAGPSRRLSWIHRELPANSAPRPSTPPPPPLPAAPPELPSTPLAPKTPRQDPAPLVPNPTQAAALRFPPPTDAPLTELSSEEALWLHGHGALFLDARRSAAFAQGHIPGARCLPAWEDGLAEKVEQLALFTPDLKAPVVVYCSGGDCQDSHLLAQKLWLAGFRNLRIYTDGYPDWEAKGRPVTKGEQR